MIILMSATTALVLLLGSLVGYFGTAASKAARAQSAADSAALAAALDLSPLGSGDPQAAARRYSELNEAELTGCICKPGMRWVQVEVEVAGMRAQARAEFDPEMLRPAWLGFDARDLHPTLKAAVETLVAETGGAVTVVSGYRSSKEQERLWEEALERYGDPDIADDWVAPPGHSMHERGLAVDLGGDISAALDAINALGLPLHRPMPWEPWHFELLGSRT